MIKTLEQVHNLKKCHKKDGKTQGVTNFSAPTFLLIHTAPACHTALL